MVHEKVLRTVRSERLKVFVVWLPMVEGDSRDMALEAKKLIGDRRASHFWDSRKEMAAAFGTVIGQPEGKPGHLAWDFYAVFDASARWKDPAPTPVDWMHQLHGVDPSRQLDADRLRESVLKLLRTNKD